MITTGGQNKRWAVLNVNPYNLQERKQTHHVGSHADLQRTQATATSVVMCTTSTTGSITSVPTSVFQQVIVQPATQLIQAPRVQPSREENTMSNGLLCKFIFLSLSKTLQIFLFLFYKKLSFVIYLFLKNKRTNEI